MQVSANFLAIDLGASNGRIMQVAWDGARFVLDEVHRFPQQTIKIGRHLHWDAADILAQIKLGISKCARPGRELSGIGIDAWGVDYGLLDRQGELLDNPCHYRDPRTDGMVEALHSVLSEADLFQLTGVRSMAINTVYQLASVIASGREDLDRAERLLLIPDLFQYFLCGEKQAEYTEATTTELLSLASREWNAEILSRIGIPPRIFPEVCRPGTIRGVLHREISEACGVGGRPPCIAVASHDTASAVAAIPDLDQDSIFLSSGTWSLMGVHATAPDTSDEALQLGFTNEGAADGGVLLLKNLCGLWILQECQRGWQPPQEAERWDDIAAAAMRAAEFRSLIDPSAPEFQNAPSMPEAIIRSCIQSEQPVPETLGEFARCVLESLALLYRRTLDDLCLLTGKKFRTIRIVGGGSQNQLLCQMTADACQLEVVAGPAEAAAWGNAMLQAMATGHISGFDEAHQALSNSVQRTSYLPRTEERWEKALHRFDALSTRIRNARPPSGSDVIRHPVEVHS